jgi:GNAT superfamily N-acetyltransferase
VAPNKTALSGSHIPSLHLWWRSLTEQKNRNIGIGKMMLSFLEEKAKEHGISSIEIPVYAFNKRASEFYENNGYHKYVERKVKEIRN